jgi:hypothetical protein
LGEAATAEAMTAKTARTENCILTKVVRDDMLFVMGVVFKRMSAGDGADFQVVRREEKGR